MDNGNAMKDYSSDLLASDLDIISDIIMGDQSEDLASAEVIGDRLTYHDL